MTFGMAHLKVEGAPAHPEDIYIHCGCSRCELRWQKQLKAYDAFERNYMRRRKSKLKQTKPA